MAGPFLCLELDASGIKATIVDQSYQRSDIHENCHILFKDLPDSDIEDIDFFDAGMDVVAQNLDLQICSSAVIFVSPSQICFRNIDLPFTSHKKIKQVLPFELETLLPGINETYISDFHLLEISSESNLLLSASILESQVETYFTKLDSFGIRPRMITPAGYAAVIGFLDDHKEISTVAFLHITNCESTLVLVNNRKPCIVRSLSASAASLEALGLFVKQTIIGFNQRAGHEVLFDIIVSSDEVNLDIDAVCAALEKSMAFQSRSESMAQEAPKTVTQEKISAGTALFNISQGRPMKYLFNFCKGKYGTSSFIKTYFSNIAAGAALLFCVLALLMLTTGLDIASLNKRITAIDNEARSIFMATFPEKRKIQDPYLQMKANVQAVEKRTGTPGNNDSFIKNKDIKVVAVMGEISKKIDASVDMEISRFLLNNGRLVLSGSTRNFNNVDYIKSKIESSDLFEKVSISSAAADKRGDRVNFKFIIEM